MKKAPNGLAFIQAAVSDDETRYFMNFPYYDKEEGEFGTLIATDGRRLHLWALTEAERNFYKLPDMPSGFVRIIVREGLIIKHDLDAQFPNWKRVLPEGNKLQAEKGNFDYSTQLSVLMAKNAIAFNPDYFKPLAGREWNVYMPTERNSDGLLCKAAEFVSGNFRAIIMPCMG